MSDRIGDEMAKMGHGVEAAVRVPPYDLVVRRLRRRRRRRAGAGGVVLAALMVAGAVALPGMGARHHAQVQPASQVRVAPPTGTGRLSLSDVSYDASEHGMLLGQRCTDVCHEVTLTTRDRGDSYGPEVTVPGTYRYVAAGPDVDVVYGPQLAVSHNDGATWTRLATPAPVADIAFADGTMTLLLTPTGGNAQLWQGPADATLWSQLELVGAVPGSDDSARLSVAGSTLVVTSTTGQPRVAIRSGSSWTTRPIAICSRGSRPSVATVTPTTWWVACGNETSGGHQVVVRTADAGQTYTAVAAPPNTDLDQSIVAVSQQVAYLYGGPALIETRDGGTTWQVVLNVGGLGPPHVPPGHGGGDLWVLAPGTNTVYRELAGQWDGGLRPT